MLYKPEDIIDFFEKFPQGLQDISNSNYITYGKPDFNVRFALFTQKLLENFNYQDAILCGGSLFAILDRIVPSSEFETSCSDLDLFILRSSEDNDKSSYPNTLRKLKNVLQHFTAFANVNNLNVVFIVRGLLIEVMIQGKRRIQLLLSVYDNPADCIGNMSVLHLHLYYNGSLFASTGAIENIKKKVTKMCRAPIKDVKIPQLISRGVTPIGDILITTMDDQYHQTLKDLDDVKTALDANEPLPDKVNICTDIDKVLQECEILTKAKWNPQRLDYLRQMKITQDIDVFDLNIRLPAPDILYRCRFYKVGKKRKILKIKSTMAIESPAIFLERDIQLTLVEPTELHFCKTDNIKFLERYFDRKAIFRFVPNVSHVLIPGRGLSSNCPDGKMDTNVSFMIIICEDDPCMYFDIMEITDLSSV